MGGWTPPWAVAPDAALPEAPAWHADEPRDRLVFATDGKRAGFPAIAPEQPPQVNAGRGFAGFAGPYHTQVTRARWRNGHGGEVRTGT